ncbi:D-xylose transport system substrate-binding protein [Clostridium cavendishii DSM 21758]|uniref:D-xylose transport system substrate-binding protein n=1 Tax=Clostridium cavendishii DSM 21758 TaxID=1121302 RepID=A0A1M6IWM2_9CLOT|nr:substrate-binding domain-containing protein [Clostridium cavendishii]SHJ38865.1 D-xylose transport system substrate-binding protein [Clostridium cavendishii DSM 21758]
MYITRPNTFVIPVLYVEKQTLGIETFNTRQDISIGVSFPSTTIPRWLRDKEAMEKEAISKGIKLKMQIGDDTPELQIKQIKDLISQGINVLIIIPVNSASLASAVELAKKAGIKVIAYARIIFNSDLDLYIGNDNIQTGELQGRFLIKKVPKGNYIIISGDPNDFNARTFKEGAMKFILPLVYLNNIKIISEESLINWSPQKAYNIVKNILLANNKIDAILAPNDAAAGAAIKALEEQGLDGKVVVTGQGADLDGIRRIIQGTQSMTVFKDTRELAKTAIASAIKLIKGEPIDINSTINNEKKNVPAIIEPVTLVTKENIEDTIIKSGYWKKEDIYRNIRQNK